MPDNKYLSFINLNKIDYKSIFQDIKEAVSGTERDFTTSKLGKAIFILALPMVLEMIMESIFAVVDIFFVSKLGADAVATVGITESAMTIVYAIGVGLSVATTALVSRRIGQKKPKEAGIAAFQAIFVAIIISLFIAIPGYILAKPFLLLMGATDEMADSGFWYPAIMFGGNVVIMLLFIINAVFRSSGDAAISMRVIWIANIINLVLDPVLIFGIGPFPELGIKGAAIATNIGRGVAVLYQLYLLFNGNRRIRLFAGSIRFMPKVMGQLLKLSAGGIMQNLIATSSWIFLVRIITVFGASAIAGYTIAIRIIVFALLPAWGLSNAASTLVGQNLGANQPDRAEKAVWITSYVNMALLGLVGIVTALFPEFFIRLFINEPEVVKNGILSLRVISLGFLFYAMGMVMVQGLNGSGDTITPTKINFVCFWLVEIPLAYLMAITLNMGLLGACLSIIIAESMLSLAGLYYFKKGKWKTKEV